MFSSEATPYATWLPILISLGAIISLTTVAITILLAQSRVFYAMAVDGLLPQVFARVQKRTKTPWVSIITSGKYFIQHLAS
jgi:APA family basic amino acid/polyamine antiporter